MTRTTHTFLHTPTPDAVDIRRRQWTNRCDVCDRTLVVKAVDSHDAARMLARINGWVLHDGLVRCPGCAEIPPAVRTRP
ncbi:hypothetical protein [Gordonia sp. NB41Y]|nr:hypothetical protein [Gordonia sp. NB41Y]WLP92869.1 hypothetical protein Q9K23_11915 [Gordonia sp. NB41Y]